MLGKNINIPRVVALLRLLAITNAAVAGQRSRSTKIEDRGVNSSPHYQPVLQAFGADFLSHFTTFTGADPTHGFINYTDMAFAQEQGYVRANFNHDLNKSTAYIGMDDSTTAGIGRNSVRLSSKLNFTINSLFVMDVAHVPAAWGQWSSFWLLGQDGGWPYSGEIDIFESVHESTSNTITLHTGPGCTVTNDPAAAIGTLIETNCNAGNANNGCSTIAPSTITDNKVNTAGKAFNNQGGAVFVTEWTTSGIDIWMFSRQAVPGSLNAMVPDTTGWPKPVAHFSGSNCDFSKAFRQMQLIINIDACGDWAGQVWQSSGAAAATGINTCADYVKNHPEAFKEAYFEFLSLTVYTKGL
ncbi:hypothetical protein AMS68_006115 [Peltaster fructicola]|uniref:GH16 domain-containing protein n=1 Tax=Peltaster fructicola TaxID=286661 RepID=A0A6H0Y176_9PEZI|nr:hypothetical protein AMS68_006115 [Peltaster fructicola]